MLNQPVSRETAVDGFQVIGHGHGFDHNIASPWQRVYTPIRGDPVLLFLSARQAVWTSSNAFACRGGNGICRCDLHLQVTRDRIITGVSGCFAYDQGSSNDKQ